MFGIEFENAINDLLGVSINDEFIKTFIVIKYMQNGNISLTNKEPSDDNIFIDDIKISNLPSIPTTIKYLDPISGTDLQALPNIKGTLHLNTYNRWIFSLLDFYNNFNNLKDTLINYFGEHYKVFLIYKGIHYQLFGDSSLQNEIIVDIYNETFQCNVQITKPQLTNSLEFYYPDNLAINLKVLNSFNKATLCNESSDVINRYENLDASNIWITNNHLLDTYETTKELNKLRSKQVKYFSNTIIGES